MKNLAPINENKDVISKEYADNAYSAKTHTHSYAGSASAGGAASALTCRDRFSMGNYTATRYQYYKLGKVSLSQNWRLLITLVGKQGWNDRNTAGIKFVTLSGNFNPTITGLFIGGALYDLGNTDAVKVLNTSEFDILLVRAEGYTNLQADIYIKYPVAKNYTSYLVLVDSPNTAAWTRAATVSNTDPTVDAVSSYIVPKKVIRDDYLLSTANAVSATKLNTPRTIDGVSFDGSAAISHYGVCSAAANTVDKVVSCPGFTLATGARIAVYFPVQNTADGITLNVNGTGAKPVYYATAAMTTASLRLIAGAVYEFVYTGSRYCYAGNQHYTNQNNATNSADYRLLLSGTANDTTETYISRKSANFTANPSTGVLTAKYFKASSGGQLLYSGAFTSATSANITIANLWDYSMLMFKITLSSRSASIAQVVELIIPIQYINSGNTYTANQNIISAGTTISSSKCATNFSGAIGFSKSDTANTISLATYTNSISYVEIYSII